MTNFNYYSRVPTGQKSVDGGPQPLTPLVELNLFHGLAWLLGNDYHSQLYTLYLEQSKTRIASVTPNESSSVL